MHPILNQDSFSAPVRSGTIVPHMSMLKKFRPPKSEIINEEALIQVWSDIDLGLTRPGSATTDIAESIKRGGLDRLPVIHVAIITKSVLYLFKAEHHRMDLNGGNTSRGTDTIELRSRSRLELDRVELSSTDGAIMINRPEVEYARIDEASFRFLRSEG